SRTRKLHRDARQDGVADVPPRQEDREDPRAAAPRPLRAPLLHGAVRADALRRRGPARRAPMAYRAARGGRGGGHPRRLPGRPAHEVVMSDLTYASYLHIDRLLALQEP